MENFDPIELIRDSVEENEIHDILQISIKEEGMGSATDKDNPSTTLDSQGEMSAPGDDDVQRQDDDEENGDKTKIESDGDNYHHHGDDGRGNEKHHHDDKRVPEEVEDDEDGEDDVESRGFWSLKGLLL